jgi:hypothetical protein
MQTELWKDIEGFEGLYQISTLGRLKSIGRMARNANHIHHIKPKILKPVLNAGYYKFTLSKNEIRKDVRRARLMAIAFIPNPKNLPHPNHINGIKTDDYLENLEWMTVSENTQHAYDHGLNSKNISVIAINRLTKEQRLYASFAKAANDLKIDPASISKVISGKANHVNNWIFNRQIAN